MGVGNPTLMKNLANDCERCSRYGGSNLNRFAPSLGDQRIEEGPRHRMDAVEVNDSVLGGKLALLERIHHEEVPDIAILDVLAERHPSLVGWVLFPGPLGLLPDRLVPGERAARAQDHI
jgi:hypothetical protein